MCLWMGWLPCRQKATSRSFEGENPPGKVQGPCENDFSERNMSPGHTEDRIEGFAMFEPAVASRQEHGGASPDRFGAAQRAA